MDDDKLYYVTEVGTFGNIDIDDPTAVEIEKKKKEEMEKLLEEAIEENKKNMKGK